MNGYTKVDVESFRPYDGRPAFLATGIESRFYRPFKRKTALCHIWSSLFTTEEFDASFSSYVTLLHDLQRVISPKRRIRRPHWPVDHSCTSASRVKLRFQKASRGLFYITYDASQLCQLRHDEEVVVKDCSQD